MGAFDWLIDRLSGAIAKRINTDWGRAQFPNRLYRVGDQPEQLRVKPDQYNDNIVINFTRLIVDRNVSQLIGRGVEFDFEGDTETEQEQYIDAVWDANKIEILLHRLCLSASESGTGYLSLAEGIVYGEDGTPYPRLVVKDPLLMTMDSLPQDWEIVFRYTNEYKYMAADNKEHAHRRVYERDLESETERWTITDFEQVEGGRWQEMGSYPWVYPFSPVLHFQNLPSIDKAYGEPDITADTRALQDRINYVTSNLSKLSRLYAHSPRYAWGISDKSNLKMGPDDMVILPDKDAGINQLIPGADFPGMMGYLQALRQSFFDISRTVDIDSIGDKLGALTNFGLRVLYQDNLSKIETKRELLGDFLEEINRRLQIMRGLQPVDCDVIFPDFLPSNPQEDAQKDQLHLNMGIVSKQTIANKSGYDWDEEQERIETEKSSEDNIGANVLRNFNRGGGGINLPGLR